MCGGALHCVCASVTCIVCVMCVCIMLCVSMCVTVSKFMNGSVDQPS